VKRLFPEDWMKRALVASGLLVITWGLAGCGENPTSPTPTPAIFAVPLGGTWDGSIVQNNVTKGDCVGQDLRTSPPPANLDTVTLTQNASDVSAIIRSRSTGLSCRYDGSASLTSFAATAVSCDAELGFQCSNGQARLLRPVGSTFTATQNGVTAQGTVSTTYNVYAILPDGRVILVDGMTVEGNFTAIRR
jgi:hypothetical protein